METQKIRDGQKIELEQLLEDIRTVVRDGQQLLKDSMCECKERAMTGAKSTDRVIREHPYQTLGVVLGAGLLAGILASSLLSRKSREED